MKIEMKKKIRIGWSVGIHEVSISFNFTFFCSLILNVFTEKVLILT